jgi:hypothetical protein
MFMFSTKKHEALWNDFQTTVLSDPQAYQSSAATRFDSEDEDGNAVTSLVIDIDPRPSLRMGDRGRTPRYALEFRNVLTYSSGPAGEAQPQPSNELSEDSTGLSGENNLFLLLDNATKLQTILRYARSWAEKTGNLYLGFINPSLPPIPEVTEVKWIGNTLHVRIQEHRNLPLIASDRTMTTTPQQLFVSPCGKYIKLTYSRSHRSRTRFFTQRGGFPPNTFPDSLPVFDLTELPED